MSSATISDIYVSPLSRPTDWRPVQVYDLLVSITGNWSMRVEMSGDAVLPDGPVTVQFGLSLLRGYVTRAGDDRGQYIGIIVGGQAQTASQGLDKTVTAQHYYQTPARDVLTATLSQVGETLAASSQGLDQQLLPGYARRAVSAQRVLDEVADMLGLYWRVLLDGTVYFGTLPISTWPASPTQFVYESKQPDLAAPLIMPMPQQQLIEPGQTVVLSKGAGASKIDTTAQRVTCAHYYGDQKTALARLWFQDPNADLFEGDPLAPDRVHAGIAALARQAVRGVDWYRTFQGEVVTQRGDGTLDINLDKVMGRPEMPPIRGAQVSVPVGGAALNVRAGDRVSVYYEGGDPRKPRCSGYETGTATRGVALLDSSGDAGTLVLTVVAPGVLSGTYTDPFGVITPVTSGAVIPLKVKITGNVSQDLKLRG